MTTKNDRKPRLRAFARHQAHTANVQSRAIRRFGYLQFTWRAYADHALSFSQLYQTPTQGA